MNLDKIRGHDCPLCGRERYYASQYNADKFKDRNCKSCANSIKAGGVGQLILDCGSVGCIDCKINPVAWGNVSLCESCNKARRKVYFEDHYRYNRAGTTKEEALSKFTGSCDICSSSVTFEGSHLDHCHDTGKFRGILCGLCNRGLGQFKDNQDSLLQAYNYLRRFNEHTE